MALKMQRTKPSALTTVWEADTSEDAQTAQGSTLLTQLAKLSRRRDRLQEELDEQYEKSGSVNESLAWQLSMTSKAIQETQATHKLDTAAAVRHDFELLRWRLSESEAREAALRDTCAVARAERAAAVEARDMALQELTSTRAELREREQSPGLQQRPTGTTSQEQAADFHEKDFKLWAMKWELERVTQENLAVHEQLVAEKSRITDAEETELQLQQARAELSAVQHQRGSLEQLLDVTQRRLEQACQELTAAQSHQRQQGESAKQRAASEAGAAASSESAEELQRQLEEERGDEAVLKDAQHRCTRGTQLLQARGNLQAAATRALACGSLPALLGCNAESCSGRHAKAAGYVAGAKASLGLPTEVASPGLPAAVASTASPHGRRRQPSVAHC